MPRSQSRLTWLRYTIAIVVCLGIGALLAWPAFEMLWLAGTDEDFVSRQNRLDQVQWIQTILIAGFLYTWFFFFGATVGSFLNVVIWRMPRGETVVSRPSRCPFCSTQLKWNDNVPVLGWIMLGGRCRTCRLPISPRYPVIETVVGLIFLLLLQFEVLSGGGNLPGVEAVRLSHARAMLELQFPLLSIYVFHCYLFSLMVCWAMIAWDRCRMPLTLCVLAYGVGFLGPMIWPNLYPVRFGEVDLGSVVDAPRLEVFLTVLCGTLAGAAWGMLVRAFVSKPLKDDHSHRLGIPIMMVAAGMYFGWQATFVIAALSLLSSIIIWPVLKRLGRNDFAGGVELSILLSSFVFVLFWKFWDQPYGLTDLPKAAVFAAAAVVLGLLLRKLTWRPTLDLRRFQRPADSGGTDSPELQVLASAGTIPENRQ
ncbi:A24 family peptidase [Bremerella sp. P1]|uniref:A24 family peptidase n=1 Tax=Bremerella sp. P1 TaxID=3026424 RepID=UPI002367A461|nr:prepilin peptidase [Bremerella sp. P1]WDI43668.1 prepilin peptidase [Bremerella sp. P1]